MDSLIPSLPLKKVLRSVFSGEAQRAIDENHLSDLLAGTSLQLIPAPEVRSFEVFVQRYFCEERQVKAIFEPCLGETVGEVLVTESGLFDRGLAEIVHLPRVQVTVGPRLPAELRELKSLRDLEQSLADMLYEGTLAGSGFTTPLSVTEYGQRLRTFCNAFYDRWEALLAKGQALSGDLCASWIGFLEQLAALLHIEMEVLTEEAIRRAIAKAGGQRPESFAGVFCARPCRSWFLPGIRLGTDTDAVLIDARGCLAPKSVPRIYSLLVEPRIEVLADPSRAQAIAHTIVERFFNVDFLLEDEAFRDLVDNEPEPNELLRSLAQDTQAELLGEIGSAVDPCSPLLQESPQSVRPRIHTETAPGIVIAVRRFGLLHKGALKIQPDLDLCVMADFPSELSTAFRWYEKVCRENKSYSWATLPETDRCFRIAMWWTSGIDTKFERDAALFLEAASRMLEEVADFDDYDVEMERAIENLLKVLGGVDVVPVDESASNASVAVMSQQETLEGLDRSRIWPHPDKPRCRWHLPGLRAVGHRPAVPPCVRREIRNLIPFWAKTLELVETLTDDDLRLSVYALFHSEVTDPGADTVRRVLLEIFTRLQTIENRDYPTDFAPSVLDEYLEYLEQQEFRDDRLIVLTRTQWQTDPSATKGFRMKVARVPGDGPEGEAQGLRERGARFAGQAEEILAPTLVECQGSFYLELFYLRAFEPLAHKRSAASNALKMAHEMIEELESDPKTFLGNDQHAVFLRAVLLTIGAYAWDGSRSTPTGSVGENEPLHLYLIYLKLFADLRDTVRRNGGKLFANWRDQRLRITGGDFLSIRQTQGDRATYIVPNSVLIQAESIRNMAAKIVNKTGFE